MDTFLEAAATTFPGRPRDTRHGSTHSLHSTAGNTTTPSLSTSSTRIRTDWTPEDNATTAITIQQDPKKPSGYHLNWNAPATATPPASPPCRTSWPPSEHNYKKRKPHNNQTTRCFRHRPHQPHRSAPTKSPSPTPSPKRSSPHNTAPPRTATGFGNTAGIGSPQRQALVGRNHTRAPGHPPALNHRIHQYLGTTGRPPPPPPHHPRKCRHHTNGARLPKGSPRPRHPHTPTNINGIHDSATGPHCMASHRHHLPRPQRPNTHLATKVGGHPWGPPPGTPRTHAHPPHPPSGARSSPSTTRHTQPGVMGIRDPHEPTSSGGHQDRTILPASPDPNPTPQHPTRLHHLVGMSRPRGPPPATSPPPPWTPTPPPSSRPRQRQPTRWGPLKPGADNTW